MSMSIKLMGVPGPKLMDDEKFTQDMFGVSTPTFVTPDVNANAQLQIESLKNAQIFYFFNLHRSHVLDLIMQCAVDQDAEQSARGAVLQLRAVPAGRRPGDAVLDVAEAHEATADIPRLPLRPPDDYLRDAMAATLDQEDVEFDIRLQVQTDPHLMPIENAACTVAGEALAASVGRDAAYPPAELRLAGAARLREAPLLQPVALHRRASPAGQPEPRATAHVLGAVDSCGTR